MGRPLPRTRRVACPRERGQATVEFALILPLVVLSTVLVPLVALDRRQRTVLAATVNSMSPASLAYKGITGMRDELLGWLQLSDGSSG